MSGLNCRLGEYVVFLIVVFTLMQC